MTVEQKTDVAVSQTREFTRSFSLTPTSLHEALQLAEIMAKSDLVPKDFQGKPGNVLLAVQCGLEVGLSPMQAMRSIAVVNGRATMWGDGLLAIIQASSSYEWHDESESSEKAGVCIVKRKGHEPYRVEFTLEDAKRAGLLGKPGPWQQYQARMLQLRARGFCLRDKFADVLYGLIPAEEALDIVDITPAGQPESQPQAKRESLKERLGKKAASVEDIAPHETPSTATPTGEGATDPVPPADTVIVYQDCLNDMRKAETVADVTTFYNAAADTGEFTSGELKTLRVAMEERIQALQPAGSGKKR